MYSAAKNRGGGGSGKRNVRASPAPPPSLAPNEIEETLSLVRGNQLNYGMIIRLAPDLVNEITRGGQPKIKFDANANNPAGNVINVGGKDFRFTWSHEPGDLCDVYEERKSGDDCNGTLVESGGAWRKLNVQRVLDESTKNHVKMRSEEAERKLKSRKAIVLDPGNPSMKNQMKAFAAAETTPWRNFKPKKEPPFKKLKPEPPSGPPKSMYKSGLLTTSTKGKYSTSPLPSPPEQSVAPSSPVLNNNLNKGRPSMENIFGHEVINKNNSFEKDFPRKVKSSAGLNKRGRKLEVTKSPDLRSMLISLLKESPSGMSFKALEKAVAEAFPKSVKQIEHIVKKIATYQAPGKYLLKPDVDVESLKKSSPIDGSLQLDNHNQSSPQPPSLGPELDVRLDGNDVEEMRKVGSTPEEPTNDFEKIDIENDSPDIFSEKRISDSEKKISDSERPVVASSNDTGTDSDSDSHDSGSRSRSKSGSPVGHGSGSSSDSGSDASSNSKEASDEDVDIMSSDNDKEKNKELQSSEPGEVKSPFKWKATDCEPANILTDDDHHIGHMAWAISSASNKGSQRTEETKHHPLEWNRHQENHSFAGGASSERGNEVEGDDPKLELSNHSGAVHKRKSKRDLEDEEYHDGEPDRCKRLKAVDLNKPLVDITGNSPTADVPHDPFTEIPNIQKAKIGREGIINDAIHKSRNQGTYGNSSSEIQLPVRKSAVIAECSKASTATECPGKHAEIVERGVQREKSNRERQDDGGLIKDKRLAKFPREAVIGKQTKSCDSHYTPTPKANLPISGIVEISKRSNPDHYANDSTRHHHRIGQPETEQNHSRVEGVDPISQNNNLVEVNNSNRESDAATGLGSASLVKQQDSRGAGIPLSLREKREHQPNTFGNIHDKRKDPSQIESNGGGRKRRDSSSDENSCPYSKYHREKPDLKGPIKDVSQYEEYVKEYVEKYDSYMSLNKILESYRNEFSHVAKDLESADCRDTERYHDLVAQLHEWYRQCGAKVKRLKKIFIVLHEELKCLKQTMKDFAASYAKT